MNRKKRRALQAINRKLSKAAKAARQVEPERTLGAGFGDVFDDVLTAYRLHKRTIALTELMQLTGQTEDEIDAAITESLQSWGIDDNGIVLRNAALRHLLKRAKQEVQNHEQ